MQSRPPYQGAALAKCRAKIARTLLAIIIPGLCLCLPNALCAADDFGPPPPSLIHDETRLFDEKATQQLSHLLQEARAQLGVSLYVTAFPYVQGGTVRDRALVLADQWSGEEPGLVIAVNRGDTQAGIAASAGLWRRYSPDEAVLMLADATTLLSKPGLPPEERVTQTARLVLERITIMENARLDRAKTFTRSEASLAGLFAAALMAFGGLVWLTLLLWRRHEATRTALFFPDVNVATRLGAPFGGGTIGVAGEEE